jgi:N-acetylmuramoyl-L-alanine amidase
LIVPGHDDVNFGTQFDGLKEVELNRALAEKLYDYLSKEEGINPVLASSEAGYNSIFERYFDSQKKEIKKFMDSTKKRFSKKLTADGIENIETNFHNPAPEDMAYKLYGLNRWVNDQKFDLVIHIHFNDYRGRKLSKEGIYDGFSIYTPGKLFANYKVSRVFADSIFDELKKIRPVSNLEGEKTGVIEDNELIALGANESLNAGAILVEYGYIYESIFTDGNLRDTSLDYLAHSTYAGVMNTLHENAQPKEVVQNILTTKNKNTKENLVWQFQKNNGGLYPPEGKDLRDCPISGYFGECSGEVE